jgi:hypothetical protein
MLVSKKTPLTYDQVVAQLSSGAKVTSWRAKFEKKVDAEIVGEYGEYLAFEKDVNKTKILGRDAHVVTKARIKSLVPKRGDVAEVIAWLAPVESNFLDDLPIKEHPRLLEKIILVHVADPKQTYTMSPRLFDNYYGEMPRIGELMWFQKRLEGRPDEYMDGGYVKEDDNRDSAIIGDRGDNTYGGFIWFK